MLRCFAPCTFTAVTLREIEVIRKAGLSYARATSHSHTSYRPFVAWHNEIKSYDRLGYSRCHDIIYETGFVSRRLAIAFNVVAQRAAAEYSSNLPLTSSSSSRSERRRFSLLEWFSYPPKFRVLQHTSRKQIKPHWKISSACHFSISLYSYDAMAHWIT